MTRLAYAGIIESSGLSASQRHDGLFWTHNDSGGGPKLYLFDKEGTHLGIAHVLGAKANDWEDMAIGPCDADGNRSCIYIGDFGDNNAERASVQLYKFPEPDLPEERPATVGIESWERIEFQYPDGARDAESLMVHPGSAEIFVVGKYGEHGPTVYRVPNEATKKDETATANKLAELASVTGFGSYATGADISPDGREFSLRTYVKVYTFCADEEEDFETAFENEPVISHPRLTIQSEALAYSPDGNHLWFTSEGKRPPLIRMERIDDTETGVTKE